MRGADSVLTRKLSRGGVARSPLPDPDFIGQTFARQVEKGLRPLVKTMVSAMVLDCKVVKVTEAVRDISVPTMLGLVEIDSAKVQGLLNIDTDFAYHLIDLMLGGDPAVAPVPIARSFTEIDMAVCGLSQEVLLNAFAEALATSFGRPLQKPLYVAAQRHDITQLRFAPDHADVLVYTLTLDIGPAARAGGLQLVLPLAMLDTLCAMLKDETVKVTKDEPKDLWKASMRHAAARSPVVLDAVLYRRRMAISELMRLRTGDVLAIPGSAVDEVQLMMAQPGGKRAKVAGGRLGAFQNAKVVKLAAGIDPRLREQIRTLRLPAGRVRPEPGARGGPDAEVAATPTAGADAAE